MTTRVSDSKTGEGAADFAADFGRLAAGMLESARAMPVHPLMAHPAAAFAAATAIGFGISTQMAGVFFGALQGALETANMAAAALDETPPGAATIDAGPEGPTNQSRPTFKFHGEAGAGFRCVVDSTPVGNCDSGEFTPATLADGPHGFTVVQLDAAGNEATAAATRSFTVDTVAPAVAITSGPNGPTNQSAPTFTVTGEGGSGLRCAIDAGLEVDCDSGSYSSIQLVNGPHSFHVSQTDAAGNTGTATRSFNIDTVAPAAPLITGGPTKATAETRPTFSFEGETGAGFRCAIDTDAPVACDGGSFTPAALGEGVHVFHLSQVDAAGNPGPELLREFTVDLTPPAAPQITSGPSGRTSQAAPSFAFNKDRNQYHTTSIVRRLLTLKDMGTPLILGVADVDLFVPDTSFVYGEADRESHGAVMSIWRLRGEGEAWKRRAYVEAVHQAGHLVGLSYCEDARCAMYQATTKPGKPRWKT